MHYYSTHAFVFPTLSLVYPLKKGFRKTMLILQFFKRALVKTPLTLSILGPFLECFNIKNFEA